MKKMGKRAKSNYDAFAEEYSLYMKAIGQDLFNEVLNFLPNYVGRALDAGCGPGSLSLKLADHVNCVVGVDISSPMIAMANKRQAELSKKNVHFLMVDLENLTFREETFDFVISNRTLHHTRLDITLPGLRRLVKPGGRMVVFDLVTTTPRLNTYPTWQVMRALKNAPGYARSHGLRAMSRILSFQLNPQWIRHVCNDKQFTPESFQEVYSHFLPGCRFERNPKTPWRIVAFWEAPSSENHEATLISISNDKGKSS